MRFIFIIILSLLSVVTVYAQSIRTYYWESTIKVCTDVPEIEDSGCDDCVIKVYYDTQGKATKVNYYQDGELMHTDKIRYIGKENGSMVYEVLGTFGNGTHAGQHLYINTNYVLRVFYRLVFDGFSPIVGHFTDTPEFAFRYNRRQ